MSEVSTPTVTEAKTEQKKPQSVYERWQKSPDAKTFNSILEGAEKKESDCLEFAFRAYAAGIKPAEEGGFSVEQDGKKAGDFLKQGAEAGSTLCKLNYGKQLIPQARAEPNGDAAKQAEKHLTDCEKMDGVKREAQLLLGILYDAIGQMGIAISKLSSSADAGSPDASYNLALIKMKQIESDVASIFERMRAVRKHFGECLNTTVSALRAQQQK